MAPQLPPLSRIFPKRSRSPDVTYELVPGGRTLFGRRGLVTSSPTEEFGGFHPRQRYQQLTAARYRQFEEHSASVSARGRHPAVGRSPRDLDPVIQKYRNDLAYAMYMLRRRHRHVSTDVAELGSDIDAQARRLGLPSVGGRKAAVRPAPRSLRKRGEPKQLVRTKLPPIDGKAALVTKTLDFFDNIPVKFVVNGGTVPRIAR